MEELDYLTKPPEVNADRVPGDWVKEVFAPIYDFDAIVAAGRYGFKEKERKVKRVPILDPLTVKDVFERVHARVVAVEKEKVAKREEQREKAEEKLIDPRKSSIWNTEELDTLRKVYKSAKGEIHRLEIGLREKTLHALSLESKLKAQRAEVDELAEDLSQAKKANQRLVIHRDRLAKENSILSLKCTALKDSWIEIGTQKQKAMDAEKAATLALDKERLWRLKLEADQAQATQNLIREKNVIESNLQTKYEMEMNDLNEVIRDLSQELQAERRQHEASKRGLDHLRQHFSSLPLQDVLPPGAVLQDQIGPIDHCSL